jgi:hypothetical protein
MSTHKIMLVLTLLITTVFVAQAAPADSCNPFTPFPTLLSAIATSGAVGDLDISCSNTSNIGVLTMNVQFTLTVPVLNTGGWTLTQGANSYTGSLFGPDAVRFTGVQYDTSLSTLSFSFTGLQVNPSLEPVGFAYHEFEAFTGPTVPTLNSSDVIVAFNDNAPEPGTWLLLGSGMLAAGIWRRGRNKK